MGNCLPSLAHESKIARVLKSTKHRHQYGMKKSTPTLYGGVMQQDKYTKKMTQEKGGGIRVKILLTKKEAAQLVDKCSESERTMMKRVLRELDKIKSCDQNTVMPRSYRSSWRPALESIPEAS